MSDLLSALGTTAHSLDAQRYGLDVVGQNLANINTPGFKRSYSIVAKTLKVEGAGLDTRFEPSNTHVDRVALTPGPVTYTGNALDVANAVRERMKALETYFPQGVAWDVPYDTSPFVEISIREVLYTLFEAMGLVFLVMWLFLGNLRATLIPAVVVPVALLGAFSGLYLLGYSVNVLTLFAMVLAIGIVVDDAIVVVENVERIMSEEGLSPREATRKAMGQIISAIIYLPGPSTFITNNPILLYLFLQYF